MAGGAGPVHAYANALSPVTLLQGDMRACMHGLHNSLWIPQIALSFNGCREGTSPDSGLSTGITGCAQRETIPFLPACLPPTLPACLSGSARLRWRDATRARQHEAGFLFSLT